MAACALRGRENGICGCRHDSVAVFLVLVAVTPVTGFFITLGMAVIIGASARITDMRIL